MKKSRNFRILSLLCAALTLTGALSGCAASYRERASFAMGSVLTARIYAPKEEADAMFDRMTDRIEAADKCLSVTDPASELYAVNAAGSAFVSDYTRKAVEDMVMLCNLLDGTLDLTIGAVTELWGFSSDEPRKPDDAQLREALATVGLQKLLVDNENERIVLGKGQKLDPGAFGKGLALDEAAGALATATYSAVVSFGGSVLLYGPPPDGKGWTVGVRDPFGGEDDCFASLSLVPREAGGGAYLSTSGSYEKCFTEDGVSYHHILSPKTGYPVENGLVSVTVYAPAGLTGDALSTALFINGLDGTALQWLHNFGAEAVFVFTDKTYYVTEGLRGAFTLTDDSFTLRAYEG